ncbi:class I SAM-dependent methyltransferase [uncultured Helicobacter sp.]|uniref:class I SAM-dependent methyltransferase n=1 Tax=uncultured Helicobacter sp. TaxID=175537 RepID=UPI00375218CB
MEYFEARNVASEFYADYKLPAYFEEVVEGLDFGARVLDFGCGFGQTLYALKNKHFVWKSSKWGGGQEINVFGIDINPKAIAHCQSQGIESKVVENILEFFPAQKFDLIITTHCLEHLPKDSIIPILAHFREHCLAQGGKLFIAVPNAQSHTGCYWAYEDFTHTTLFTAGSLIYALKMAGFSDVIIIDKDALAGSSRLKKLVRKVFLKLYKLQYRFWNKITASATHSPSPDVFSYEIKALAST